MKRRAVVIAGLAAAIAAGTKTDTGTPQFLFADEFDGPNGSPPDPAKWTYDIGAGGWGNGEMQDYTDSTANCFQDGQSHLVIRALRSGLGRHGSYTSARIKTEALFTLSHGTFEARIKLNRQPGTWPAFWLLGPHRLLGWPQCGEIDVMESYGDLSWPPGSTVHTASDNGQATSAMVPIPDGIDDGWHTYRVRHELGNGNVTFCKDGKAYFTVKPGDLPNWPFGKPGHEGVPLFMILNLAVGGTGGGGAPPASTPFPVDMLVDWVHVWQ